MSLVSAGVDFLSLVLFDTTASAGIVDQGGHNADIGVSQVGTRRQARPCILNCSSSPPTNTTMPPKKGKSKTAASKKKGKVAAEPVEEAHVEESVPVEEVETVAPMEVPTPPQPSAEGSTQPSASATPMEVDDIAEPLQSDEKAAGPSMSMDERQAKLEQLRLRMVSHSQVFHHSFCIY